MLSRFSSLFVYVVVGLVISAAATPMGTPPDYDDGSKSPSYPGSPYSPSSPKYPADKPYAKPYAEKPYPEEKKYPEEKYPKDKYPVEKKYPEDKYPKDKYSAAEDKDKYPEDKDKYRDDKDKYPKDKYPGDKDNDKYPKDKYPQGKYPDGKDKPYGKDKSYNDGPQYSNNCNVGKQHCCNAVNKSENEDSQYSGLLSVLDMMGMDTTKIKNSDKFMGIDCSPDDSGTGDQCNASPMCCEDNYFGGLLAVGCSNLDLTFPIEVVDDD